MKSLHTTISIFLIGTITSILLLPIFTYAAVPTFHNKFVAPLEKGNEKVRSLWDGIIDRDMSIKDNVKKIFYPEQSGQGWRLWDIMRNLWFSLFIIMIVIQWFMYIINAKDEEKFIGFHKNFIYIFLWGLIFFSSTWILWTGLWLENVQWSEWLIENIDTSLMFQVLGGLRALAFFAAIVLLIFTWRKTMSAMDKEDKFKTATRWILNVVISLLIMKIIDYIYFIAQVKDFQSKATELIVEVSKTLWYILWWAFTLMIIYYGFRLMFSWWNDESLKKVKNIIIWIFLGSLVIFLFFLIIYQIAQEFA